jgi:folylpolyglutamate synthase
MSCTDDSSASFDSAVQALLSPLHQATTKEEIAKSAQRRTKTIQDMRYYWGKLLLQENNKPTLPQRIIHITGTKGKGSTACMCESILRKHGLSTGLFTSPHLMDIRERIRWNGRPIHPNIFGNVYWKIRKDLMLEGHCEQDDDQDFPKQLPGYFRMLTLVALYTFRMLQVDVLILEVGMGGRYDATNFLLEESTTTGRGVVCGVTLLDLDHTRILGNTLELIAWEKGGIFAVDKTSKQAISPKPTVSSEPNKEVGNTSEPLSDSKEEQEEEVKFFVLDSNTPGVLKVLRQCAQVEGQGSGLQLEDAKGAALRAALQKVPLGLAGQHQYGNATLAVHLCQAIAKQGATTSIALDDPTTLDALASASWPGRCQTVEWQSFTFRLDGAHTPQSLRATMEWFTTHTTNKTSSTTNSRGRRVLVFTCSHERNPVELLQLLVPASFSQVYFAKADSSRPSPISVPSATELLQAQNIPVRPELLINTSDENGTTTTPTWQETLASVWNHLTTTQDDNKDCKIQCNVTATQVLDDLSSFSMKDEATDVLVTGSLYLVGSFLTAIEWSEESSPDTTLDL